MNNTIQPYSDQGISLDLRNNISAFVQAANTTIDKLSSFVEKTYYSQLDDLEITPAPHQSIEEIIKDAWFFKIEKLAYGEENESISQKLDAVVSSVNLCGGTFVMILEVEEDAVSLLMGVYNSGSPVGIYTLKDTLRDSLKGNFPGMQLAELSYEQTQARLRNCFGDNTYGNACVTAVSSIANANNDFHAGLDTILSASNGQIFKMLILANPADPYLVNKTRSEYENLSTQISQLLSLNIGKQLSQNVSTDWHTTVGDSVGTTFSHSITTYENEPARDKKGFDYLLQTVSAISALSGRLGIAYGLKMVSDMVHDGEEKAAKPPVRNDQDGGNEQHSEQKSTGGSRGDTQGKTLQYTVVNRSAKRLYDNIEKQLLWLDRVKSFGLMNVCAYIMSPSPSINANIASRYNAMIHSGESDILGVNTWTGKDADMIRQYLASGNHPMMKHGLYGNVSPSILMSGKELAHHLALPKSSLDGISIDTHASFGRKVLYKLNTPESRKIKLGNIFHMGMDEDSKSVLLSFDDLVSHTLVGGACGIGKTTAVCSVLTKLDESGIPFLVIEPAKGEYKKALSGVADLKVYSPMPVEQCTDALKLNLFWFREGVDPCEHIEKLKEIFCACWPMYAAMPQILNTALCNAYKKCGWNLKTKKNILGRVFPSLKDVCTEVKLAIDNSEFSKDVKNNYAGSLLTRLESLGTGMFEQVFSGDNLSDEELFEECVVLDLSRPDASEFKALVTGIIIMRLFEYCVCSCEILENRTLKHITVLEEAHNLLGKVKPSSEGADMREKSVEMFSRCITELGGFGQGFLIADQSPSILCDAVIKNTNTKILFNMPDTSDYVRCGESIALNPKQIQAIPELGKGICVVKQTSWENSVLCHVEKYGKRSTACYVSEYNPLYGIREYLSCLLKPYSVIGKNKPIPTKDEQKTAMRWAWDTNLEVSNRRKLAAALRQKNTWRETAELVNLIISHELISQYDDARSDLELWTMLMLDSIGAEYTDDCLIGLTVIEALLTTECDPKFRDKWFDFISARRKNDI